MSRKEKAALGLYKALAEFLEAFGDEPDRNERWRRLVTMVEDAGRTVTGQQWRDMGVACGYHPSGLGGLYVGPNPTMVKNADGTRTLTDEGVALLNQNGRLR